MKPLEHAKNNVEKYGGIVADYIEIHEVMDSTKQGLGDKRHRAITHNTHFVYFMLPRIFGSVLKNSDEKEISVSQIGEDHLAEDFGDHGLNFLPTISDWLASLPMQPWMDNGREYPPSRKGLKPVYRDAKLDEEWKKEEDEVMDRSYLNDLKPIDWANVRLDGATKKYREMLEKEKLGEVFLRTASSD